MLCGAHSSVLYQLNFWILGKVKRKSALYDALQTACVITSTCLCTVYVLKKTVVSGIVFVQTKRQNRKFKEEHREYCNGLFPYIFSKIKCSFPDLQFDRYGNLSNTWKIMTPNGGRRPDGRHLWVQEKEEIIKRLMLGLFQLLLICSVDEAKVRHTAIKWMRRGQEGNDERLKGEAWGGGRCGWKCNRNRHGLVRWADLQEIISHVMIIEVTICIHFKWFYMHTFWKYK